MTAFPIEVSPGVFQCLFQEEPIFNNCDHLPDGFNLNGDGQCEYATNTECPTGTLDTGIACFEVSTPVCDTANWQGITPSPSNGICTIDVAQTTACAPLNFASDYNSSSKVCESITPACSGDNTYDPASNQCLSNTGTAYQYTCNGSDNGTASVCSPAISVATQECDTNFSYNDSVDKCVSDATSPQRYQCPDGTWQDDLSCSTTTQIEACDTTSGYAWNNLVSRCMQNPTDKQYYCTHDNTYQSTLVCINSSSFALCGAEDVYVGGGVCQDQDRWLCDSNEITQSTCIVTSIFEACDTANGYAWNATEQMCTQLATDRTYSCQDYLGHLGSDFTQNGDNDDPTGTCLLSIDHTEITQPTPTCSDIGYTYQSGRDRCENTPIPANPNCPTGYEDIGNQCHSKTVVPPKKESSFN
jgi:hypothetical protein